MVDFRKSILLAAMALAIGVGTASAQQPGCTGTTGAVPTLRSEGQTELTGTIVLTCANIAVGVPANFDVTLNNGTVPITSRLNEGLVTITDPATGTIIAAVSGQLVSTNGSFINDLRFTGVPITIPNPQIAFTGVRANVNPNYVPLNTGGFGQVLTIIAVSNAIIPISVVNNGFFVGIVLPGLAGLQTIQSITLSTCGGGGAISTGASFIVGIPENFPTAFKTAFGQNSELGNSQLNPTSATQFAVSLNSLPAGVTFYVPVTIFSYPNGTPAANVLPGTTTPTAPVGTAELVSGPAVTSAIVGGVDGSTIGLTTGVLYAAATSGQTFYYNVVSANATVQESFYMPVFPIGTVTTSAGSPTISVVLAPNVTIDSALGPNPPGPTKFAPIFISLTTTNSSLPFGFTTCQTSLLFPYMTNQAGFDTGLSIAATGTDPFGTAPSGGTCTLNMYGANPPATAPVLTVPAGGEGHSTVSAVAPNFQGYVIAVCDFVYGHGYAFLSNGFSGVGNGGLSEGYVALEIGNTRGNLGSILPSTSVGPIPTSGGESLSH